MPLVHARIYIPVFIRERHGPIRTILPLPQKRQDEETEPRGRKVSVRDNTYTDFSVHEAIRFGIREGILNRPERIKLADARVRLTKGTATADDAETIHYLMGEISYRWTRKHTSNKP